MKTTVIKKVIASTLCMSLCFGLLQSNVMAADSKSGQDQVGKLVDIKDGNQIRKDIIISEDDKLAALQGNMSVADLVKKYGSKSQQPSKISNPVTNSISDISNNAIASPSAVSSVTGSNTLNGTFFLLNDNSMYGGDQSLLTSSIGRSTGCGPIAGCNVLAYHAKYYGRTGLYPYSWLYSDWLKYQDAMFNIGGGIQNVNSFNTMINTYTSNHGYRYSTSWQSYVLNNDTNLTSMCSFIKSQIDSNNPVAMLIGTNTGSPYMPSYSNHWVTITAYNFNNGSTDVTVSSWGTRATLNLATLLASRAWMDVLYTYAY